MKTIVYQSYRTTNVPDWIKTCMSSVQVWADSNNFEYRTFDDSFFAFAPDWFRNKANNEICPVTDLARLVVAKDLLSQGFDRTIWIDADMLVFDPANLIVDLQRDFLFCHEVWLFVDSAGQRRVSHRVNNSLAAFCTNNIHLEFFIDACLRIGRNQSSIGKLDVGTRFLSQLRTVLPFALLEKVGMLSPLMMNEIATGKPQLLIEYAHNLTQPIACANLCASLHGVSVQGIKADHSLYETVVQTLLASRGDVINKLRRHSASSPSSRPS